MRGQSLSVYAERLHQDGLISGQNIAPLPKEDVRSGPEDQSLRNADV